MTWFTSDWHLGHHNIIKYCKRPFSNVREMNTSILSNFRNFVSAGDVVYFLGDIGFDREMVDGFFKQLPPKLEFHCIRGNHDRQLQDSYLKKYCASVSDIKNVVIEDQPITLCHYPMVSHHRSHYGAWQLYGHHHRDVSARVQGQKYNVGVDHNFFCPVSFWQIKALISDQPNWDFVEEQRWLKQ